MTDGSKPVSKRHRLKGVGLGLGPPKPGGWSVSSQGDVGPASPEHQGSAESKEVERKTKGVQDDVRISLDEVGQQFFTRLQLLLTYCREIGTVARATSFANSLSIFALLSEMAEASRNRNEADALASFSFDVFFEGEDGTEAQLTAAGPIYEPHHYQAVESRMKYHDAALRLLHETSVQQLVNFYERLIGDIARSYIFRNAQVAAKNQSFTYEQILEFGSLDEVKRAVVEAQVTDLIRKNDTVGQLKWLKEQMNVDVRSQFPEFKKFRHLELRRHAIVHAGGIATSEYLRQLKKLGGEESATEGTPLVLSSEEIEQAWEIVYALGAVTVHLASVGDARRLDDRGQEERADGQLNAAAFWAIEQRRYGAAERILTYAHKRRLSKTTDQLMVLVNLAQTYKWQGRDEECTQLLSEYDWEATSDQFRVCVAVLREEAPKEYLARAVKNGDITLANLYEWPVFSKFREQEEFPVIVEEVFGPDARRPLEKFPASLLDFSHEETVRKLFEHFDRRSRETDDASSDAADDDTVH